MTAATTTDVLAWEDCLDRLELCLAEQRAALEADCPEDVRPFSPGELGPLPPALGPRARQLHAEAMALQADVAAATADVGRQLRLVTTMGRSGLGSASIAGLLDNRG